MKRLTLTRTALDVFNEVYAHPERTEKIRRETEREQRSPKSKRVAGALTIETYRAANRDLLGESSKQRLVQENAALRRQIDVLQSELYRPRVQFVPLYQSVTGGNSALAEGFQQEYEKPDTVEEAPRGRRIVLDD